MTGLPGYDTWKLAGPDDDCTDLCPWCGAYSTSNCELEDETASCSWEDSERDPDHQRDLRNEDREFFDHMGGGG